MLETRESHPPVEVCAFFWSERRLAYDRGRRDWPEIRLSFQCFEEHLLALGYSDGAPREASAVYLCLGCARGIPAACAALEAKYFDGLRAAIGRIDRDLVDEVLQEVRSRLLVGPEPRIGSYRGNGSLGSWLRAVALNVTRDHLRASGVARARRGLLASVALEPSVGLYAGLEGPDELAFRARQAQVCEQALSRAIGALPSDQRGLLYNHLVLGLSIDVLGQLYGVNRSTAARRIQRALYCVQRRLWAELELRLGQVDKKELADLIKVTSKQMESSAAELFRELAREPTPSPV